MFDLAIIGCGAITNLVHVPTVLRSRRFNIAALVDTDLSACEFLKLKYGLNDVALLETVDGLRDVDAALVAVPPHLHRPISSELFANGLPVYCEKPMATTADDAQAMLEEARAAELALSVGAHKFFYPNTRSLLDVIGDEKLIGDVQSIELIYGIKSDWNTSNPKRYDPKFVPGGVVFENGIHWLYRLIHWFGQPELVRYEDDRLGGVEGNAIVVCEFRHGDQKIPARLVFSATQEMNNRLIVVGSLGQAEIADSECNDISVTTELNSRSYSISVHPKSRLFESDAFFLEQLDHFAEMLEGKAERYSLAELSLAAMRFIEVCYKNRRPLNQPWVFADINPL